MSLLIARQPTSNMPWAWVVLLLVIATGCGHWPPSVDSAADIANVPASEKTIYTRGLPDEDIPALAQQPHLTGIDFGAGVSVTRSKITDKGLERLAKLNLPNLDHLGLGWCDKITDAGIAHVCRIRTLKTLLLTECQNITDAAMSDLANCKNLTYLDLRACRGITDKGIESLAQNPNWQWIVLDGAPNVTGNAIAKLRAALPQTKVRKDDAEWEYQRANTRVK
jgi:hypothetical protein